MTLNVTMKEDSKQLDEVVVVGYGTTTRKNLTTSIATVKTEKYREPQQVICHRCCLGGLPDWKLR